MPYQSGIETYLKFLDGTQHSLRVAVYELTEPRVVDKVLELKQRGIKDIIILLDKSQTVAPLRTLRTGADQALARCRHRGGGWYERAEAQHHALEG